MSNIRFNTLEINEIETDSLIIGNWTITLSGDSSSLIFSENKVSKFQIDGVVKYGCTDSNYLEYDATADLDNGSCSTIKVNGCTNALAINYNASANTDDNSCELDRIFTYNYDNINFAAISAANLNASLTTAITSDITSTLAYTGISYVSFTNGGFVQTFASGSAVNGITQTFTLRRLESNTTSLDQKVLNAIANNTFVKTQVQSVVTANPSIVESGMSSVVSISNVVVEGCTSSGALNYNNEATISNNTCITAPSITANPVNEGTIQVSFTRQSGIDISTTGTHQLKYYFDNDSTTLNSAYAHVFTANVTSSNKKITIKILNADNSLFLHMGSLTFTKTGCTITNAVNYNPFANTNTNSTCSGCTDANAKNYSALIVAAGGSSGNNCIYAPSRHVVENEITMEVDHQSAIVFGASSNDKQLQYYFDEQIKIYNNIINVNQIQQIQTVE